jgi:hypothetical protein
MLNCAPPQQRKASVRRLTAYTQEVVNKMRTIYFLKRSKKPAFNVINHKLFLIVVIFSLSINSVTGTSESPIFDHEKQVRDFVAAFNARDLSKMLELTDDDIKWLSINGAKISIETEGKTALKTAMEKYFSECPTCKSSLEWVQIAGSRITAMEIARWTSKSGPKEQSSLSVYEFQGGKIARVYYFPAEVEVPPKK